MEKNDSSIPPPCLISIDKEGRWYHKGAEMIRRDFIRMFYQNIELDAEGRHILLWDGKRCLLDVEDTAYVVHKVVHRGGSEGAQEAFVLFLSDDSEEPLRPGTLRVGDDNVMYCRVKHGAFPARLTRAAYYQLAEYVQEEDEGFFLRLNGKDYAI